MVPLEFSSSSRHLGVCICDADSNLISSRLDPPPLLRSCTVISCTSGEISSMHVLLRNGEGSSVVKRSKTSAVKARRSTLVELVADRFWYYPLKNQSSGQQLVSKTIELKNMLFAYINQRPPFEPSWFQSWDPALDFCIQHSSVLISVVYLWLVWTLTHWEPGCEVTHRQGVSLCSDEVLSYRLYSPTTQVKKSIK